MNVSDVSVLQDQSQMYREITSETARTSLSHTGE